MLQDQAMQEKAIDELQRNHNDSWSLSTIMATVRLLFRIKIHLDARTIIKFMFTRAM